MSSVSASIYRRGLLRPRSKGDYHSMCLLILIQAGRLHPLFPWLYAVPEKKGENGEKSRVLEQLPLFVPDN